MSAEDLLRWVEETSRRWHDLVLASPQLMSVPCDIRESNSLGQVLQHIVAVELRYAQRLHSLTESSYDLISAQDADAIYQTHRGAMALLRALGDRDEAWWQTPVQFMARNGGTMRATRRTVMLHALLHSIRHYAQLATIARRAGIAPGWSMDYLSMELLPVSAA